MKYVATIGEAVHEVWLTEAGLEMEGRLVPAEIAALPGTAVRHLRLGDRGFRVLARRTADGWLIDVEGRSYRVRVEDERTRAIRELASDPGASKSAGALRAPMPGLIVRVEVKPGQRVEAGTPLVVMEAMKMENELKSVGNGTIAAVEVREGQAVDRDDVLVRFK
ncbi:MAG: acetyl-CoA carboxylase biotin carboxyl carrier protein subunit [Gemmatimonadota bacterium]